MAAISWALSGIADLAPLAAGDSAVSPPTPLPQAVTPTVRTPTSSRENRVRTGSGERIMTSKV
jgi:hypothetical protein